MYLMPKLWTHFSMHSPSKITRERFEVTENNEEYKFFLALVGTKLEDVMIDLEDDLLMIKVASNEQDSIEESQLLWSEFDLVDFEQVFRLPRNINKEEIEANLVNGLLEIRIPKLKPNKQKIRIQSSKAS